MEVTEVQRTFVWMWVLSNFRLSNCSVGCAGPALLVTFVLWQHSLLLFSLLLHVDIWGKRSERFLKAKRHLWLSCDYGNDDALLLVSQLSRAGKLFFFSKTDRRRLEEEEEEIQRSLGGEADETCWGRKFHRSSGTPQAVRPSSTNRIINTVFIPSISDWKNS